jgi:hypothetical protein
MERLTESRCSKKFFRIYVFTQILLVGCAALAFYRFYWLHQDLLTNIECISVTIITSALLGVTLSALWRGHKADPGFVVDSKKSEDGCVCSRCGVSRPSDTTHHCSSCNRCVVDMDHHCVMMDNCVGKHSLRFFVQYSFWMSLLLLTAIMVYIKGFYWQNASSG